MKKPILLGLVATLAALPASAIAGASSLYEKLPQGSLALPTHLDLPESIPATEHAEGIYVELPDYVKNNPSPTSRYVQVFGSQQDRDAYQMGVGERTGACLSSASTSNTAGGAVQWNGSFSASTSVAPYARSYTYGPEGAVPKDLVNVQPVRIDKLVDVTDAGATLESRVVLVDAQTLGTRQVHSSRTKLDLVQSLPGRMRVFGAKDGDGVTFVVHHAPLEGERSFNSMFGQQGGSFQSVNASENCPVTFSMPVRKDGASTMVLQLEATLEIRSADPEDFAPRGEVDLPPSFAANSDGPREARIRPMQIGFSSTWMSQDKTPVVTISHGWTGKERVQPM